MKYVFFDIECACVYKSVAKICAFGYVVADEKFNVLEREEILLNPKGKFHLTDRKGGQGIVLPYEYEDFKKYPIFPAVYKKIKALLEDKESMVCGHATINDVNYLNLETRRFKLPSFQFRFYDTQFFYMNCENSYSRQFGLQTIAEALGVDFTPHRAVDDAYATMRVCEAICKREETDMRGLVSRYGIRAGKLSDYRIKNLSSAGHDAYVAAREKQRERNAKERDEFFRFVNKHMPRRNKGGSLDGKVFCFAKDIETDSVLARKLVGAIFDSGGKYTSHPAECNVYIARGNADGMRCRNALTAGAAFVPLDKIQGALGV